jgi:dienelactone hydrolase
MKPLGLHLAFSLLLMGVAAHARLVEEQFDMPVKATNAYGKEFEQTIKVTVFSDTDNPKPAPVLVLNHGRAAEPEGRASLGRSRFGDASRFFVNRGFIVVLPTRIGYGVSGGEDVEDTGACNKRNYPPGYAAAAQQALAALAFARTRPDAAPDRAVMAGQSFGGATAATLASMNPPGVQLAINFAGGGGGNPKTQPQRPCMPQSLERMYGDYGKTAKVPMLWIYAENDLYWGPKYPKEWFQAYTASGAKAEMEMFPPHGDDGHALFTRFPEVWQPRVAAFLDANGYPAVQRKGK